MCERELQVAGYELRRHCAASAKLVALGLHGLRNSQPVTRNLS